MSYNFTLNDMEAYKFSSNKNDIIVTFPKEIGFISTLKYKITEDILLLKTKILTSEKILLHANSKIKGLVINIVLDGENNIIDNNFKREENFKKNSSCIKYMNEYDTTTILDKNSNSLGIIIEDKFLEKNFNDIFDLNSFENFPSVTLKNQISKNINLAKELFNSPFEGKLHDIYLQSKVFEIIYNEFSEIMNHKIYNDDKKVKLNQDDIEALYKAKDIILTSQEFPDLVTLSKKVALNQFKLKYGFRQLFNTSPGNMILEQKMIYAKQLLETSEFSISEISNFVGYKYQSNFTNAFIKFFGVLPKDIMVQRKYYY
ncbi:helix-turn-helix domain-containing protein [Aliarcobacter vitoriensis]|uniref:AraC family transcriptional regulator n=1 Tax=Aliarcobacter vitoriensis TaxID=2011099 RepID=A0A366MTV0_9BACT|nr:AraC family transcriptional regulator [Aliarcobacter vitoriensis]RBQ29014.1 AraC family transcriptional regulator [Aliarcobacter vitoriensis]